MIASTLFVRVVSADRARGFMLLVGWDAKIVQATAVQLITLSGLTRASLDATIARVKSQYTCSDVRDVTADGIKTKLRIEFNEPNPNAKPKRSQDEMEAAETAQREENV